jgi:hypothetical protein
VEAVVQNVCYSQDLERSGELYALAKQGTAHLEEVLGRSASVVRAEWDRVEDARGRTAVELRLWDGGESATARFAPDEMANPYHMRSRLYTMWGDLLQTHSDRQVKKLQELVAERD